MLNGGYVAAALLFIAALFGVLIIGLAARNWCWPGCWRCCWCRPGC